MFQKRFSILFLTVAATLFGISVNAQTAKAEQQKLGTYEAQLKQLQADLHLFKEELAAAKTEKKPLEGKSGPEKAALDKIVAEVKQAQAKVDADPSYDNKSQLQNAEFRRVLAERKYENANQDLFKLRDKVNSLTKKVNKTTHQISQLKQTIARQRVILEQTRAREKARAKAMAERKAKQAEQQRLKAAAAARLKAELAKKQREEAARKAAEMAAAKKAARQAAARAPKAATGATATTTPKANTGTMTSAKVAPPPAKHSMKAAPTKPAAAPTAKTSPGGVVLLTTRNAVKAEQTRLNTLLATPDESRKRYNKILNVKPILGNGKTGPAEAHALEYLGHNQYRGTAKLKGGNTIFAIGFNHWRESVPASPKDSDYIVILDASNPQHPRLMYYREDLAQ